MAAVLSPSWRISGLVLLETFVVVVGRREERGKGQEIGVLKAEGRRRKLRSLGATSTNRFWFFIEL